MHSLFVASAFLLMVISPCLVAMRTGITGDREYEEDYYD
jgi:hypothetical protein